jgi:hypothetical protein
VRESTADVAAERTRKWRPSGRRLTAILMTALAAGGIMAASAATATPAQAATLICKNSAIPPGWVIVGQGVAPTCPGATGWFISLPNPAGIAVCQNSPIPPGYVITGQTVIATCPDAKGYIIRVPTLTGSKAS